MSAFSKMAGYDAMPIYKYQLQLYILATNNQKIKILNIPCIRAPKYIIFTDKFNKRCGRCSQWKP